MSNNLEIYAACAEVPKEAKKEIKGGRLKGMTDINPMWRIKKLTELFGPVGFGWYYKIIEQRLEPGALDEVLAFVTIELYINREGQWSMPIQGVGGNKMTAKESRGLQNSDECFKMATTDAISVAAKCLGLGASVYFEKDKTKYDTQEEHVWVTDADTKRLYTAATNNGYSNDDVKQFIKVKYNKHSAYQLSMDELNFIISRLKAKKKEVTVNET